MISRRRFLHTCAAGATLPALLPAANEAVAQSTPTKRPGDDAFLDDLQSRTFSFFWETANPANGLVPDRWPKESPSSVAAVGFGLAAYGVGVERGYISRDQAIERVQNTLRFFADSPQSEEMPNATGARGFYYHFIDMKSGKREWECELSSIDTALLMCGVLFCREYFDKDTAAEREIRDRADALYRRIEWTWMQPRPELISMAWKPDSGFLEHDYKGYDEAMLLYILALGSPTHPVRAEVWQNFTSTYKWGNFHGQEHVNFSPLFGHQYSHAFIDFRGIRDPYMQAKPIDYFENSRRATYSQRAYAVANPLKWKDYGPDNWGLTACDGPGESQYDYAGEERRFSSYAARGASVEYIHDDGTIAPTAAGGSIPFAPEICIPALQAMRKRYGNALYSKYGFLDSFNPSFTFDDAELQQGKVVDGLGWFDTDYLGIDQGPIILMAENHRSDLIWKHLRKSPYIRQGLALAGFNGGWLEG
jgi:hypothetical protein